MIITSAIDSIFVVAEVNSTIPGTAFASQDSDCCLQSAMAALKVSSGIWLELTMTQSPHGRRASDPCSEPISIKAWLVDTHHGVRAKRFRGSYRRHAVQRFRVNK